MPDQGRTLVESLTSRTPEDLATLSADRLTFDLDLLFDKVLEGYAQWKVAENEWRATQRLLRFATRHEDEAVARGLAKDAAYLAEMVAVYAQRWQQYSGQWTRYWAALRERVDALDPEAS